MKLRLTTERFFHCEMICSGCGHQLAWALVQASTIRSAFSKFRKATMKAVSRRHRRRAEREGFQCGVCASKWMRFDGWSLPGATRQEAIHWEGSKYPLR